MNDAPIGVFDSGMGGLTVMRALMARLPNERFVYLGDTARLPYGTKSADTVRRYALQAAHALTARGVKMVVVACNTASVSLPALKDALAPLPVVGVIEPGAEAALTASKISSSGCCFQRTTPAARVISAYFTFCSASHSISRTVASA